MMATKSRRMLMETHLIFEPVISNSICMHERSLPSLCNSRLIVTGAKYGFFASKGLKQNWGKLAMTDAFLIFLVAWINASKTSLNNRVVTLR